jgi:hypothetical protein
MIGGMSRATDKVRNIRLGSLALVGVAVLLGMTRPVLAAGEFAFLLFVLAICLLVYSFIAGKS